MKYIIFLAVSAIIITGMGCGNESAKGTSGTTETTLPVLPGNSTVQPQTTVPVNLNSQTTPTTIIPTGTTTAGLNPAHGEPGHRCDIGVGQPLNSSPAQKTTPTLTPTITPTLTTPATTPINISTDKLTQPVVTTGVTTPGMNPAHGEPGHRCDIAVGAPLSSKPAQPATNIPATNITTPVNIPSDQVAKTEVPTKVAPGMNPAHGEPGHRCDISVGAPLSTPVNANFTPPAANKDILPKVVPIKPISDSPGKNR